MVDLDCSSRLPLQKNLWIRAPQSAVCAFFFPEMSIPQIRQQIWQRVCSKYRKNCFIQDWAYTVDWTEAWKLFNILRFWLNCLLCCPKIYAARKTNTVFLPILLINLFWTAALIQKRERKERKKNNNICLTLKSTWISFAAHFTVEQISKK